MVTQKHKIMPHLWFDKEATAAAAFYTSVFPNSAVLKTTTLRNTPSGDCDVVSFELSGQPFMAISAGPLFKFNPSISFIVNFDPSKDKNARKNLDTMWEKLSRDGTALMPLDTYPFSEHYGWIQDRYGLSWQLLLSNPVGEERPFIVPSLMFVGPAAGKAEEAINFYRSVFANSKQGQLVRWGKGQEPEKEGTVMFADFMVNNQWFAAMDSMREHKFAFNEAISLIVPCDTQEELDHYWKELSADPKAEQCGWLKDKYGLSWQITPVQLNSMLSDRDPKKVARVTQAFLRMKKFDLKTLRDVFEGN